MDCPRQIRPPPRSRAAAANGGVVGLGIAGVEPPPPVQAAAPGEEEEEEDAAKEEENAVNKGVPPDSPLRRGSFGAAAIRRASGSPGAGRRVAAPAPSA